MQRRKHRLSRPLALETLEDRRVMTGNVTVSVSGGDLVITGDTQGNQIQVIQALQNGAPIPGRYFITGQNATRINGQTTGQFVSGVNDDFRINLNGGDDRLTMGDGVNVGRFIVPDDLEIDMGAGADNVLLDRISVRDDARVVTGAGRDIVTFRGTVGGLAGVDGGNNDLTIETGNDTDIVFLENFFARRNLSINTGNDTATDFVELDVGNVGNDTQIRTGAGTDSVEVEDVGFNDDLTIDTGDSRDVVSINRCQVDELFVSLGSGNDSLTLRETFGSRANLNGNGGTNTFVNVGNSFSQSFQASNLVAQNPSPDD